MSKSRALVLETLRGQSGPTALEALARAAGLHVNTVREHLDALLVEGLVTRSAAVTAGRGRPPWLYEATDVDPPARSEYAGLASALASAIHDHSPSPTEDAVSAGRAWGRDLARESARDTGDGKRRLSVRSRATSARRRVVAMLDRLGFAPEPDRQAVSVRLTRCPLLEAAHRYPEVVCGVHLGLAQGALEANGVAGSGTQLYPFSEPGACRLELVTPGHEPEQP
jgi:predicted ArsR family transcriptional regulator